MGNIALLIIAIAFAVLVLFIVIVLVKVTKTLSETNRTIKLVSSDVDVLLHQADSLMGKANVLLDDVNGKVATIDPLFTAVADLSESISAVNNTTRGAVDKFTRKGKSSRTVSAVSAVAGARRIFKKDGKKVKKVKGE